MKIMALIEIITSPVKKILQRVGLVLNQCPTKKEAIKVKRPSEFKQFFAKKKRGPLVEKKTGINPKRHYRAKGHVNTSTTVFNKPRGDLKIQ